MSDTTKEVTSEACDHKLQFIVHLSFPDVLITHCTNPECDHRAEYGKLTLAAPSEKIHLVPVSKEDGVITLSVRKL